MSDKTNLLPFQRQRRTERAIYRESRCKHLAIRNDVTDESSGSFLQQFRQFYPVRFHQSFER